MKGEKQLSVGWILDAIAFDSYHDELAAAVTRNGHSVVSIKRPNPPYQWDDTGNSYRKAFPPGWDIFVNCSLKRSLRRHLIHPDSMVVSIGSTLLKYIVPRIALADLRVMLVIALVGGFVAGLYGIVHDQVTYSISPEYFTKLKFNQFSYANFGLGERVFASTIGFLATWWVGFLAAWFLGRRLIPNQPRVQAYRQIRKGIICIIAFGLSFGIAAYGYGLCVGQMLITRLGHGHCGGSKSRILGRSLGSRTFTTPATSVGWSG